MTVPFTNKMQGYMFKQTLNKPKTFEIPMSYSVVKVETLLLVYL